MRKITLILYHFFEKILTFFANLSVYSSLRFANLKLYQTEVLVDTRNLDGLTKMYLNPKNKVDEIEFKLLNIILKKSSVIFDIGSNIGFYSIYLSKIAKNSKIYSVEPYEINLAKQKMNIALNKAENIVIIDKALGDKEDTIKFYVPKSSTATAVASTNINFTGYWHKSMNEVDINQTTLDNLVEKYKLETVDFIKLDVENYEYQVLLGAIKTIKRFKPSFLIEIHLLESLNAKLGIIEGIDQDITQKIQDFFIENGYFFYCLTKLGLLKVDNLFSNIDSNNYLVSVYNSKNRLIGYEDNEIINMSK
jgi:FkbM family methyltransferase